ncbi:glycosyl hydrolase [Bifidobacterium animalis subsp. lactis]|uniref:glycoside hydrolase 5 family protein n=1 Tax=Bifidobacterium animalis TaxID=28025 RepID=UPI00101F8FB9|nr:cellulase family glycosylhydrolase [Bifidobacterium animalis]RYM91221.1 glycosyl hydrolase [Bifidobacterium animalis subsp. lactis]RYM91427.1 glycosyl hydrolase [Bifidobacterium animalis subsp. lactis]
MKFGVNYTPSHGWFHAWLNPDWDSIARDFDQIAAIGMDHVRIFAVWPYLQPNRTAINQHAVDDVCHMVHLAGRAGLDAYVDVLQGHLSSFDFLPSWMVTWHARDMFTDEEVLDAQRRLIRILALRLGEEPAYRGMTLGNEINQFSDDPHPTKMACSPQDVNHWLDTLLDAAATPHGLSLYSVNDGVWFMDGHPFTPRQSGNKGDLTTVHSWVFNGMAQGYGARSEECHSYALYLMELARAFSDDPDRPVWLQEVGAPENVIDPMDTASFCEETVRRALDCPALWGITWWCSHDVPAALSDFPPFEHHLGLFDEAGNLKDIGRSFARMAREHRNDKAAPVRTHAIVVPTDGDGNPLERSTLAPGGSICDLWMHAHKQGLRPTIVTSRCAANKTELRARGIRQLQQDDSPHPGRFYTAVSDPAFEDEQ